MQKEVYEFISKQTQDPIVERKTCKISGEQFAIFQSDVDFYEKVSPVFGGKTINLPVPSLCPEERWKRRLLFKNERALFRNICASTSKPIISIHAPDSGFQVFSVAAWRSDSWNPMDYGRVYDPSIPFFDQYKELYRTVPQIAIMNDNGVASENIEYCQNVAYSKNCYLTTVAWKLEHSYYSSNMAGGNWLLDCFFAMASENCYECCDSNHLYWCVRLQYAYNCQNCRFGYDLAGCKDCIGCVNLRDKQYCIYNKQYTKEAYESYKTKFLSELPNNFSTVYSQFQNFVMQQPHRALYNTNTTNTYSSNLFNAENTRFCYNIQNAKDTKYCLFGDTIEDAMDLTVWWELHLCYEGNVPDHSYKACFTVFCRSCTNILYSEMCHHCQDCFWCVGLRNKQYCILNKQYTKEEYETLVPQIIEHMQTEWTRGEFFYHDVAPYAYNVSTVMDYFPLTREEALVHWYRWRDVREEINMPTWIESITAKDIPRNSNEVADDILKKAVVCEISGRPFRVLAPELDFYRKWNIPFPHKHPDVRFEERLARMPKKQLNLRHCDKCGIEMLSVYKEQESFQVFCEQCYNKEIYW